MNTKQVFSLFSILLLSACHDDFLAGVSLGGTGTGEDRRLSPFPPQIEPDPSEQPEPPTPQQPPTSEPVPTIIYPDIIEQYCQGIQRTLSFIDPYSHEPKLVNSYQALNPEFGMPNNIALNLKVCNTTSHQVYEYIPECKSPLQLLDEYGDPIPLTHSYSCPEGEALQLYQANQCKTYILYGSIRTLIQNWQLSYSTQYSFDTFKNIDQRTQCDAIKVTLPVIPMNKQRTDPDQGNIEPISSDEPQFPPITITPA